MIFTETRLPGAFVVDIVKHEDPRGFFARTWCRREAEAQGIEVSWVQSNVSYNRNQGTLRGMHYQFPDAETKLVEVVQGAILDVIVDLRPNSATYLQHFAVELSASNHRLLLVPAGFAHGFVTLADDTTILYQMSAFYNPDQACGFRWDDPRFAIQWPPGARILSDRDRQLPCFAP